MVAAVGIATQGAVAIVGTAGVRIENGEVKTHDLAFCENLLNAIGYVVPAQIIQRGIDVLGIEVAGLARAIGAGEGRVAKGRQSVLVGLVPDLAAVRAQAVALGLLAVFNIIFLSRY